MIRERNGKDILIVFDDFFVDRELPKYKVEKDDKDKENGLVLSGSSFLGGWGVPDMEDSYDRAFMEKLAFGNGFWNAVLYTFMRKTGIGKLFTKKGKTLKGKQVQQFFDSIKTAKKYLNLHNSELLKRYESTMQGATDAGQTALVEKLKDKRDVTLMESKLVELGFPVYLKEDDLIEFYKKTERSKNLKMVWVKNFLRLMPEEVIETKKKVDQFKIFDNYVVVAFDPLDQMSGMTKQEVQDSKDPILFGVIKDSNKLYFIADWEDEFCNLRLETVLETLSKDKDLLNKQQFKIYDQK